MKLTFVVCMQVMRMLLVWLVYIALPLIVDSCSEGCYSVWDKKEDLYCM